MRELEKDNRLTEQLALAQSCIEEQDYDGFLTAISIAKHLAGSESEDIAFWYIKGLYQFNKNEIVLQEIDKYLKHSSDARRATEVLLMKGVSESQLGHFAEAQEIFEQLINHEDVLIRLNAHNNLTWLYLHKFQVEKQIEYLDWIIASCHKAVQYFERVTDDNLKKKIMVRLATAYLYKGNADYALDCYFTANELVPNDPNVLNNIAVVYVLQRNTEQARAYLEKAERESEDKKDYTALAYSYEIFAELTELTSDYSKAREYYLLALDYFVDVNLFPQVNECLKNILRLDGVINGESISVIGKNLSENVLKTVGGETHNTLEDWRFSRLAARTVFDKGLYLWAFDFVQSSNFYKSSEGVSKVSKEF